MSAEKLWEEARRWIRQAKDDLEAASLLLDGGKHAQAGFLAQQAAEKAVKGLLIGRDLDPWGHSVVKLLQELPPEEGFRDLVDAGLSLDKLYIPTRHPDALPTLIPAEAYSLGEIAHAVTLARTIVARVIGRLPPAP